MSPLSFSGYAPWLLLLMLVVGVVHHLLTKQQRT